MQKILIMGLPGSGKTTLATKLAKRVAAVHFNADEIRNRISKDLGFSLADRIENATRMSVLMDIVQRAGHNVIVDMVCPLSVMRSIIKPDILIWCDTIQYGRFEDTNKLFEPPTSFDLRVPVFGSTDYWVDAATEYVQLKSLQRDKNSQNSSS